jgi:ribosomal-protein-serine acetyltransferase
LRTQATDSRIRIRAFRPSDARPLHEAVRESIDRIAPFETWCHPGFSRDEAREYVDWWIQTRKRGTAFYYVVENRGTSRFCGVTGLGEYSVEHRHATLGYWMRSSEMGKGIATAAARLLVSLGFSDLKLLRIAIGVPVANVASHRVAEKLGAVREGVLRRELVLPGGPSDVVLYSLMPDELKTG